MNDTDGRQYVTGELQTTGLAASGIRSVLETARATGRRDYQASRWLTYHVTWTEDAGYKVSVTDTSPADWTFAYRKRTANRFQRAADWRGTWRQADRQAQAFMLAYPHLEVAVVPTRAYEDTNPTEDSGNVLTGTGRRVRITEDGTVAGPYKAAWQTLGYTVTPDEGTVVTPAPAPKGHPRHQLRKFTVTLREADSGARQVHRVTAQTEHDAIFRAGVATGQRHPDTDLNHWHVTGVHDPAPATWTPGQAVTTEQETSK